ncbi:MAG: HAMP domain-containing protein [Chitinispirillaceae bacterium]|nr:HAMP domain-containing protein [Chitinispirillaceae bacterium]
MRITIAPKLFLGYVVIIVLNVFFLVIVSNLENVNSIAALLKRQNEIKNRMLRLKALHRVQAPSIASFERLGRQESVDNFSRTQSEIISLCDSINEKLDSIKNGSAGISEENLSSIASTTFQSLKSSMDAILLYNNLYETMFDSIVRTRNTEVPKKKSDVWHEILDEAGAKLTRVIDSAEAVLDLQTNERIKEVELRVTNVRAMTIYILISVTVTAIIFAFWFSTYITNSLRRLTVSARNIGKGNFNVDPHGYPRDEIGDLASAFFQMSIDLKNVQEALVRSKRLAAIGEVVASVNHEINNPLMIISGNAQFLQMTMADYPEEMRERVRIIIEETDRISRVTRKLREIKNPVVEDYTSSGEQMINLDKSAS